MRLKLRSALVAGATAALLAGGAAPVAMATASATASGATGADVRCDDGSSAARVKANSKGKEPAQDPQAKAYGQIKSKPLLAPGSVTIPTVFHMIQPGSAPSPRGDAAWTAMVNAQMKVLNDSYSGVTGGANTPFRFSLESIEFVKSDAWYNAVPGKGERAMKKALHEGNSETLNVYAADTLTGGLLGWAYFPKEVTNNGRDYVDGVVMLDESMPGGNLADYNLGDTLTHEVGHWFALHHTFHAGCSAANDFVADTPQEAAPQFECPAGVDTCSAPGEDPIHNFMDYSPDSCMYMFTPGQAQRMNDAWLNFRAIP